MLELRKLEPRNIGKNVIIWTAHNIATPSGRGCLWIKVIDYRKGYWAETYLSVSQIKELLLLLAKSLNANVLEKEVIT